MVNRFCVAVINKGSLESEARKRFTDRNYSKRTLDNYTPNVKKAKFIERKGRFSIYEIPLKKIPKQIKLKKGDKVKIVVPFSGYSEYGLRKGGIGIVKKQSIYRGMTAYQVEFPSAGKELSMFPYEIRKVK